MHKTWQNTKGGHVHSCKTNRSIAITYSCPANEHTFQRPFSYAKNSENLRVVSQMERSVSVPSDAN